MILTCFLLIVFVLGLISKSMKTLNLCRCCSRLAFIGDITLCVNFYIYKFFCFKAFLCTWRYKLYARIYHSCIDVHKDFDSCTNGVVSTYPSASTLLNKDAANIDSLCIVDTFSSHIGLSRVFDSHSLDHNKPLLSTPLLHITTLHINLHFHLTKNNVHGIMKSFYLLVENSWYLFMHNAYWNVIISLPLCLKYI